MLPWQLQTLILFVMNNRMILLLGVATLMSCSKPGTQLTETFEETFRYEGDEDVRELILRANGRFVYSLDLGYMERLDSGTFIRQEDLLILNPESQKAGIDSVIVRDGNVRFLEVLIEEYERLGPDSIRSEYRPQLYPKVVVNGTDTLELWAEDSTYQRLALPPGLEIHQVDVYLSQDSDCPPGMWSSYRLDPPAQSGSLSVYIPSANRLRYYLAQAHWLIRGDTVYCRFLNDDCLPSQTRLVRSQPSI